MKDLEFTIETAACLWEAAVSLRDRASYTDLSMLGGKDRAFLTAVGDRFKDHGTAEMRMIVIGFAQTCANAFVIATDDAVLWSNAYDWHWCPAFLADAVDWTAARPAIDPGKLRAFAEEMRKQEGGAPIDDEAWKRDIGKGPRISVSIWQHKHGEDLAAHADSASVDARKAAIAAEEWEREMDDEPMPADPKVAAAAYFDAMGDRGTEWFNVEEVELAGL